MVGTVVLPELSSGIYFLQRAETSKMHKLSNARDEIISKIELFQTIIITPNLLQTIIKWSNISRKIKQFYEQN